MKERQIVSPEVGLSRLSFACERAGSRTLFMEQFGLTDGSVTHIFSGRDAMPDWLQEFLCIRIVKDARPVMRGVWIEVRAWKNTGHALVWDGGEVLLSAAQAAIVGDALEAYPRSVPCPVLGDGKACGTFKVQLCYAMKRLRAAGFPFEIKKDWGHARYRAIPL